MIIIGERANENARTPCIAARKESRPAIRIARVAALAEQIFGDKAKADRWMRKPKRARGGATPLACLASKAGAQHVEEMLYRIDSGFFA